MAAKLDTTSVTREGLLAAMAEYDRDTAAFHAAHGTSERGCRYWITHGGKRYPSKAIVAAAAGAAPSAFSGGKGRLGAMLARLGFRLGSLGLVATAPGVVAGAAPAHEDLEHTGDVEATYFASGSNTPAQIRGFSAIGQALGVAAPEVSENGENALHALAGTGIRVFVDSGAFSEVEFSAAGPQVVRPIDEARWQEILDLYARLGATLGRQLYVVAPDMVGFQGETLARVERWRTEIRSLIEAGVNVIVVAQKGEQSQADFDAAIEQILGTADYVRGLPCNKAATTPAEVAAFAAARKPARLHLLGLGLRNAKLPAYANAVAHANASTLLTLDSCLICESTGKTNGRASHPREVRGGPRVFTWAKDAAKALIAAGKTLVRDVEDLAIRLAWGDGQVSIC